VKATINNFTSLKFKMTESDGSKVLQMQTKDKQNLLKKKKKELNRREKN
jgi:hypothetical protein